MISDNLPFIGGELQFLKRKKEVFQMKKVYTKPEIDLIDLTSREELMLDLLNELDPLMLEGDIDHTSKPDGWD